VAKRKADAFDPRQCGKKIKSRTYTKNERRWELFQKRAQRLQRLIHWPSLFLFAFASAFQHLQRQASVRGTGT
jgi:hypothetical protein